MNYPTSKEDHEPSSDAANSKTQEGLRPKTPRWVWVAVAIVAVILVLLLALLFKDGGKHGPSRHIGHRHSISQTT